ncbi:hypothetical protein OCU04_012690 [Sclerotinia nivalis]|uniref:Cytochrome P450 n=1 Tax=Sclerotinia nivalis TaxID=352851 RepID=A0A9X0DD83_9HELO|nr:hypothetical protein OCU04_012690 [Sclerotinia nivalis]
MDKIPTGGTATALCALLSLVAIYFLRVYTRLQHIPGPFLAAFSNIPRMYWVWTKRAHEKHIALHKKYGSLVRIGPDVVSVGDPAEISHIYGFDDTFSKSDFYSVILPYNNGKAMPGLISAKDNNLHRSLKRPISNIYSMSNLVSFERFVDSSIERLCSQLEKSYAEGAHSQHCDLSFWLQAFVFDTLGELTFSQPYGFVEQGKDIEGIMGDIWSHFERVSLVGQMPWIDTFLRINPLLSKLRPKPVSPIAKFSMARIQERKMRGEQGASAVNDRDLLSRFIAAQAQNPGTPPFALFSWIAGNITAGSDTTATVLRSLFYYLLKNPATLEILMSEIAMARKAGLLSNPPTWKETQDLRYLDACVMEAQRLHPPVGLHLERVVPQEGATLCGKYIQAGTVVGINAWVVHRDTGTFGEDVDVWRPERWVDCTEEQRARMDKAIFTFGAGSRVCVGKNFSLLIIYKLLPSLLQRFEVSLADPHATWTVENRWFVVQRNLLVNLKRSDV